MSDNRVTVAEEWRNERQQRAADFVAIAFGVASMAPEERAARFLEEALELVQALGMSAVDADRLLSHVYSKPRGDAVQEAGGVGITLLALASACGFSADRAERQELERVEALPVGHFRRRHNLKADAGVAIRVPEK